MRQTISGGVSRHRIKQNGRRRARNAASSGSHGGRDLPPRLTGVQGQPFAVAAEEQVDGRPVGDELVFLRPPCEPRAGEVAERREQGQARPHRLECVAVGDVKLDAAAILPGELLERRTEASGPEGDAGQVPRSPAARQARRGSIPGAPHSSNGRVVPRPSERLVPSIRHWPG